MKNDPTMCGRKETHLQDRAQTNERVEIPLGELSILTLDCQATGANPRRGRLLEIGWMGGCAAGGPQNAGVRSCLIRQPRAAPIPAAVARITGISEADLRHAVSEEAAWKELISAAQHAAAQNRSGACPLVIHFARFEIPFLRRLHEIGSPGTPFPFRVICTHAIARRLLPDLPRRGMRALAGYFDHAVPELKRSADHALATLAIWKSLLALLQSRCGVDTLQGLEDWLAVTPLPGKVRRTYPMDCEDRRALPEQPGVYRMRRANGDILYVGKAKSLRQRVNSYFRGSAAHAEHILEMLTQARALDFAATASALEAAVLESDEIKRHCPPYNIALRPGKRSLIYCTRDLLRGSIRCEGDFSVGPLPSGRSLEALCAVAAWLAGGMLMSCDCLAAAGTALRVDPTAPPADPAALQAGFDLFRSTHRDRLKHPSALRVVASLGARLWRAHGQSADCPTRPQRGTEENEEALQEEVTRRQAEWCPADIAAAIEGLLVHTAHMLRRARWFQLLVDSGLAWAAADDPHTLKHLLVFENGIVVHRASLRPGRKAPDPLKYGRSSREGRKSMDMATYDRMRVVTTELRRLSCEGRAIELRLSSRIRLSSNELKKALQWV